MISRFTKHRQGGFTLIEIIGVLVIAAILGAMMYQYFGTSLTQSSVPIHRLKKAFTLQMIMENITADYRRSPSNLNGLRTTIGAQGTGQNNSYGQYSVVDNHYVKIDPGNPNEFIAIDPGDPEVILKVTIQNDIDETLTVLFT